VTSRKDVGLNRGPGGVFFWTPRQGDQTGLLRGWLNLYQLPVQKTLWGGVISLEKGGGSKTYLLVQKG